MLPSISVLDQKKCDQEELVSDCSSLWTLLRPHPWGQFLAPHCNTLGALACPEEGMEVGKGLEHQE